MFYSYFQSELTYFVKLVKTSVYQNVRILFLCKCLRLKYEIPPFLKQILLQR